MTNVVYTGNNGIFLSTYEVAYTKAYYIVFQPTFTSRTNMFGG